VGGDLVLRLPAAIVRKSSTGRQAVGVEPRCCLSMGRGFLFFKPPTPRVSAEALIAAMVVAQLVGDGGDQLVALELLASLEQWLRRPRVGQVADHLHEAVRLPASFAEP